MTAVASFFLFLRRHLLVGALLVACAVGSVGWFLFVMPIRARLATAQSLLRAGEEEATRQARERAAFDRLQSTIKKVRPEEFAKIDRIVPRGRDVPHLILELEALASETGILLKNVALQEGGAENETALPKGVHPIGLVITVTGGDYVTLKHFLESIEKNGRIMDVRNFTFAKGLQSYTITIQAYYRE